MVAYTLPSTFFLTLLLAIGLTFFIRASTKDRTQTLTELLQQPPETALQRLKSYFQQRAYQEFDSEIATARKPGLLLRGYVTPSLGLAIFLTCLALIGFFCLALVLAISLPAIGQQWFWVLVLAPLAGVFYWRGAGREEEIQIAIQPTEASTEPSAEPSASTAPSTAEPATYQLQITAHRDELIALRQSGLLQEL
ncbi:MAG: cofactor assembly of complex C subunit B [Cyanobacteria bacterium P01_H01_bin.121]